MTTSPACSAPTVLVLGGTKEGRALVTALRERFVAQLRVILSLSSSMHGDYTSYKDLHMGPFGGVEGLKAYLQDEHVAAVLAATHPFATTIAHNVSLACEACGVPHLILRRPPWVCTPADRWIEVDDMTEAAQRLPTIGRRAFLTIGTRALPIFSASRDMWFLIRLPRNIPLPRHMPPHRLVIGCGRDGNDLHLMRLHAIDVLVTKASGGAETAGKIAAARTLALPVLMIRRPPAESGWTVSTVPAAVAWVEATVG
ncbi:Cobalt-precorrin-6x reductase [invertebrate metagenome]|uniref:Cobalt-precorrin-6x reductase n=1 Tax=invertebrate metagenome TaxID=1711999 RepID=A0A484H802_9ZZZZ